VDIASQDGQRLLTVLFFLLHMKDQRTENKEKKTRDERPKTFAVAEGAGY
jgi:hypothetical protein